MTEFEARTAPWQVSQVIEFAADLAEITLAWVESEEPISDELLFDFWGEGRQLTADWSRRVALLESTASQYVALDRELLLVTLAREILSMEVPVRVFSTALAALDRRRKLPEYRPIAEHVLFAMQYARSRMLALVLTGEDHQAAEDRFRRRCERWTDMLIGPCLVRHGTAAFAHNARRSWEFGEDLLSDSGMDVVETLVRPSLLAAFRGTAGQSPIQSPNGATLLLAMRSMVPSIVMTDRLERWSATPRESTTLAPVRTPDGDGHAGGWSLLDRCLRMVESRRTRGE